MSTFNNLQSASHQPTPITLCHLTRVYNTERDKQHVSWQVLNTLQAAIKQASPTVDVQLVTDINKMSLAHARSTHLFVNNIGDPTNHAREVLREAKAVTFVVEDPNWYTFFNINRPFNIITWSRALARSMTPHRDIERMARSNKYWCELANNIGNLKLLLPVSLTDMTVATQGLHMKPRMQGEHVKGSTCYIGSLKNDRAQDLHKAAVAGLHIYGNFTSSDLATMNNVNPVVYDRSVFHGPIPTHAVVTVMSQYEQALLMPDSKLLALDMDTLRNLEHVLSGTKAITVNSYLCNNKVDRLELQQLIKRVNLAIARYHDYQGDLLTVLSNNLNRSMFKPFTTQLNRLATM